MKRQLSKWLLAVACLFLMTSAGAVRGQEPGGSPAPAKADAASLFERGKFEYQDANFPAALDYLKRAYELEPKNGEYARHLGLTYEALRDLAQATALLQQAAALNGEQPGIWFDLGRVAFSTGRYEEAIQALQRAEQQEPGQAEAYYYHGLALNKSGRYGDSPPLFERALSLEPRVGQGAYYHLGVALFRTSQDEAARKAFERAIELDPGSQAANSARSFVAAIAAQPANRPLRLSATLGFQYDDNVIQQPAEPGFQLAGQRRNAGDWSGNVYFTADWRAPEENDSYGGLGYSFCYNHYLNLDHLDLIGNTVSTYAGWRPAAGLDLRITYTFSYYNLDYDNYLALHDASPSLLWRQADNLLLQTYVSYKRRLYTNGSWNTAHFPIDDLDANNYSGGFLQYLLLARGGNIYAGYRYDREAARADDFSYHGHQGTLGAVSPIWRATRALAEVSYYRHSYDTPFRGTSTVRDDQEWLISAALSHDFNRYLQGALRYLRFENHSSVNVFRYERNIYVLSLTAVY